MSIEIYQISDDAAPILAVIVAALRGRAKQSQSAKRIRTKVVSAR
jgi:hypothetical protein